MANYRKNNPSTFVNIIYTSQTSYDKLINSGNATEGDIILEKYVNDKYGILHTHGENFYFADPELLENASNTFVAYEDKEKTTVKLDNIIFKTLQIGHPDATGDKLDTLLSFGFTDDGHKYDASFWDDVTVHAEQLILQPGGPEPQPAIDVYEEIKNLKINGGGSGGGTVSDASFNLLNNKLTNLQNNIDTSFNNIDVSLSDLLKQIHDNTSIIATHTNTFTIIDETFKLNQERDNQQAEKISAHDTSIKDIIETIKTLQGNQGSTSGDITTITNNINNLSTYISNISTLVNEHTQKLETIDGSIGDLSTRIKKNTDDITELKNKDISLNEKINANNIAIDEHKLVTNQLNVDILNLNDAINGIDASINELDKQNQLTNANYQALKAEFNPVRARINTHIRDASIKYDEIDASIIELRLGGGTNPSDPDASISDKAEVVKICKDYTDNQIKIQDSSLQNYISAEIISFRDTYVDVNDNEQDAKIKSIQDDIKSIQNQLSVGSNVTKTYVDQQDDAIKELIKNQKSELITYIDTSVSNIKKELYTTYDTSVKNAIQNIKLNDSSLKNYIDTTYDASIKKYIQEQIKTALMEWQPYTEPTA